MGLPALLACIERTRPRVSVALPAVHAIAALWGRRAFASVEVRVTAGRRWFWGGTTLEACHQPGRFEIVLRASEDDAAILFTSGSTGAAKGVASKQRMFAAQVAALDEMLRLPPGSCDVQAFAAFAVFDLCLGLTSILPRMDFSRPAKAEPADIVAAITSHGAQTAFASPIVWQHLSRWAVERGVKLPSLSTVLTVGAPIPASLHRRLREVLPPSCQVWTPYGATEGLPLTSIGTDEVLGETHARTARGGGTCVGRPAPGAWLRIVGITEDPIPTWSDDLALPPGALGEIVAGGPQVSPEYKDAPEANRAAKIVDGDEVRHRMGDIGYFDEQGRLWFCGRKAHRIELADGVVLGADAVEGIFDEHPRVFRTALVGLGPRGRQIPVLCVELERGERWTARVEEELVALARGTAAEGRVARYLPHPGFPTDARHNSKIRREELAVWAARRLPELAAEAGARG
jgi:acyl-CoA synthetase (AMP-forming)/AMP-acid ligase II